MMRDQLRQVAQLLLAGDDAGMLGRLFSGPAGLTIPRAYELQAEVARLREQRGERVIGFKIGCVSRAVQEQLGIDQPIFGRLFDSGCFRSPARLANSRYTHLAVEGELAVRLAGDWPGPAASEREEWRAVGSVFPVIELHNHVLSGAPPSCAELVARNGLHAGLVLADEELPCPASPAEPQSLSIRINEEVVGAVAEPWTMGGPLAALRWLAGRLKPFGLRLTRGQLILTGSPMRLFPVRPDDRITVAMRPRGTSCAEVVP